MIFFTGHENFSISMRRRLMPRKAVILFAAILMSGCSVTGLRLETVSPRSLQKRAFTAVFEVVVKKPSEASEIVYEEPPDFSVLPYSVRTDEYAPVGTAFAISPTEAVTAFHVLNPASKSAVYHTFYLRQRDNDKETNEEEMNEHKLTYVNV
jgi:hypothetical protein